MRQLTEDEAVSLALDILAWQMGLQLISLAAFGLAEEFVRGTSLGEVPLLAIAAMWSKRAAAIVFPSLAPVLHCRTSGTSKGLYCRSHRGALVIASAVGSALSLLAASFIQGSFGHAAVPVFLGVSFLISAACLMMVTFGFSETH